jgi:hypothetical protein
VAVCCCCFGVMASIGVDHLKNGCFDTSLCYSQQNRALWRV